MARQKVLIVTRNLPPLIGGMERLNWHIADELSHDHDVIVLSHSAAKQQAPQQCQFFGVKLNPLPLFLILAFIQTLFICLKYKPDIIFAGSGLTAPIAVFWAKIFRKKSMVYLHGLDIATNHWLYNQIWIRMISAADRIIANSSPTHEICLKKGICADKLSIIFPGVTYPPLPKNQHLLNSIQQQYELEDKNVLISVGRLTERKGLNEFVNLALPEIIKKIPNTVLVIIGDTPTQSLNKNLQSKELILNTAHKHNIAHHLIFVGNISDDQVLSTWYYLADLHVFPVKHIPDDPEGFGMVAIEAAAHGTPTVAFATGGVVDAVQEEISGYLIDNANYKLLAEKTISVLEKPLDQKIIQTYSKKFAWDNLCSQLNQQIKKNFNPLERAAHASLNIASRVVKAQKIEHLLELKPSNITLKVLEIGCGSGGIAHYFATHPSIDCEVSAVDVYDNRVVFDHYNFQKVEGVALPFPDNSFDLVITNHVIEHVGEFEQQLSHIQEIKRVLVSSGQCYLAVPNRWMLTEPHYQLKFLSWLPKKFRNFYLKLWGKGDFYDCEPLRLPELERLLWQANVIFENMSVDATKLTLALEQPNSFLNKMIQRIPNQILAIFKPIIPTLIYRIRPFKNEE